MRHRAVRLMMALFALWLALMFHVRGHPIPPPEPDRIPALIANMVVGSPTVLSQAELDRIGAVAAALTAAEGKHPGPFHLLYIEELDALEKFHHLMHGPFTGIKKMYCDLWIHSITTYGTPEATWGLWPVVVRPSLKLPILLFLLDRLAREKTATGEYTGAVFEAFAGMEMNTLAGRSRLWDRVVRAAQKYPVLGAWVEEQLRQEQPDWTDDVEVEYWRRVGTPSDRAFHLRVLGAPPSPGSSSQ